MKLLHNRVFAITLVLVLALAGGLPAAVWADERTSLSTNPKTSAATDNATTPFPARFDAREQGWVIDLVRQQDPWGSCWAISALEAMETNLLKQGVNLSDSFSVRQLVWAAGTSVPQATEAHLGNSGIQAGQLASQAGEGQHASPDLEAAFEDNAFMEMGGNYYVVYQTVASGRGPVYENEAPYRNDEGIAGGDFYSATGTWGLGEDLRFTSRFQLKDAHVLPVPAGYTGSARVDDYSFDEKALGAVKQAIQQYGSVAIAYDSSEIHYDASNNTWFSDDSVSTSHGVQIVGWDDSIPAERFTTGTYGLPEGDGAWIVRNSWGADDQTFPNQRAWGDKGYFYLSYYDRSAQMFVAYEMIDPNDTNSTNIINQYDFVGQMSQASARLVAVDESLVSANVFTAECDQELRAVSVDTYAPNTKVTAWIYLLPDEVARPSQGTYDPTQGSLLEEVETTFSYGGYHRIALPQPHRIAKGQRFAVVERVEEPDGTLVASMEAGNSRQAMQRWGYYHYDTVVVNEGESYVHATLSDEADPSWMDATVAAKFLTERSSVNTPYGNICIKAFSTAVSSSSGAPNMPVQQTTETDTPQKEAGTHISSGGTSRVLKVAQANKPAQVRPLAATGEALGGYFFGVPIVVVGIVVVFGVGVVLVFAAVRFIGIARFRTL